MRSLVPHAAARLLLVSSLAGLLASGAAPLRAEEAGPTPAGLEPAETLLLQEPTISQRHVVFVYAADLWIVERGGGEARRLTSSPARESGPLLSPDGLHVAYACDTEGNTDVYVLPVAGGTPRRLTWHPDRDRVLAWHPDGRRLAFASPRLSGPGVDRAFLIDRDGGPVGSLPLPEVADLSFDPADPSGQRVAYTPWREAFRTWKRYRGGRTSPIWVTDLGTLESREVPHVNANDAWPCWWGGQVHFASDRDGSMDLYTWTPAAAEVQQVTRFTDFDVRNLSVWNGPGGAGALVFEQAGALHVVDAPGAAPRRLTVRVRHDGLHAQPRWQAAPGAVRSAALSPNGKRVAFEVRGEILSLPKDDGDARNLTETPGAHERDPAWSPDGTKVAWFSDAAGEMALHVAAASGQGAPKAYALTGAGFYYDPQFSPDGKHVLFSDRANRLAYLALDTGKVTEVARLAGSLGVVRPAGAWSPDGAWIAYEARDASTLYDRIALFELATARSTIVTDGFATAESPVFSRDGKLLFFKASVEEGPRRFGLDMSASAARDGASALYLVVLARTGKNPLFPKSDEGLVSKRPAQSDRPKKDPVEPGDPPAPDAESGKEGGKEGDEKAEDPKPPAALQKTVVDVEGLDQRILALPLPAKEYGALGTTKDRLLFLESLDDGGPVLKAFDFEKKKTEELARGVQAFQVSNDASTLLLRGSDGWNLVTAQGKDKKKLGVEAVKVRVDPAREWPQTLREVWRIQRDFFYDPALHGVDWPAMWTRWQAFLPHVRHRSDLNVLVGELIGELACGHEYVSGGEVPSVPAGVGTGLLGADFEAHEGRWRLARVLKGQNWNPGLRAPLTEPGVDVKLGEYLLAVDGEPLFATQNLLAAFEGKADRQVDLTWGTGPTTEGSRRVKVVPSGNDRELRRRAWIEERRAIVERLAQGRLAYVYMPDTGPRGLAAFTRDYYAQLGREGLVLDERYNGGGKVADHVIDVLDDPVRCWWMTREGWTGRTPFGALEGPKVMLINGYAGSGGDAMPWMFRQAKLGPLVGTRTWGGLVGITGYPPLMDGGSVTAAAFGIMDCSGRWIIENEGVAPDIEVFETPLACRDGRDPTLEAAVRTLLDQLPATPRSPAPTYVPPTPR